MAIGIQGMMNGGGTNNPVYPGKVETIRPGYMTNSAGYGNSVDAQIADVDNQILRLRQRAPATQASGVNADGSSVSFDTATNNYYTQLNKLNKKKDELLRQKSLFTGGGRDVRSRLDQARWNEARKHIGGIYGIQNIQNGEETAQ